MNIIKYFIRDIERYLTKKPLSHSRTLNTKYVNPWVLFQALSSIMSASFAMQQAALIASMPSRKPLTITLNNDNSISNYVRVANEYKWKNKGII